MAKKEQTPRKTVFLPQGLGNEAETLKKITGLSDEAIYKEYQTQRRAFPDDSFFRLKLRNGILTYSTLPGAALLNQIICSSGAGVLLPSDLHDDTTVTTVLDKMKKGDKVDMLATILRGPKARLYDERVRDIAEAMEEREEIDTERLQAEPALVTNLGIVPAKNRLGFQLIPLIGDSFEVVYSPYFASQYDGMRFNGFDEDGVPTDFAEWGRFKNCTDDSRVSSYPLFSSGRGYELSSAWDWFDDTCERDRTAIVTAGKLLRRAA